jgi:lipopolysaccharide transport system ATP-binding protein
MSRPAITVDDLGKRYRLGHRETPHRSFREALVSAAAAPLRRLRRLGEPAADEDSFWALRGISFEVQPGETIGIIGRNGAGKSTLLKILSRIVEPSEGSARLRGRVASLLEVGTGFHPELTGRENIYLNGSILGMKKVEIDRKFDEIVAFAEIEKFLDTPVKHYSSGMYVRLAFAVAAHLEPEILIVDEVLAVGDAEFQDKCLGKMRQISRTGGRTVVFVSHNMPAVQSLCQRCCVIDHGQLVYQGPTAASVDLYLHRVRPAGVVPSVCFTPTDRARPHITRAELLRDGQVSGRLPMGDALTLVMSFSSEEPPRSPKIGVVIHDREGRAILSADTQYQSCNAAPPGCHAGKFVCDFGVLPLMPGRYTISLWLSDPHEDYHVAEHALLFEVVERDAWGLGKVPRADLSLLWWPTDFRLVPQ